MPGQTGHPGRTTKLPLMLWLLVCTGPGTSVRAEDCNNNGFDDTIEIAAGISTDCDGNHIPDDCDTAILAGFELPWRVQLDERLVGLASGDFDEDGLRDLVTLRPKHWQALLLTGTVGGKLADPVKIPLPPVPSKLAVADFNADAHLDLAVYSESEDRETGSVLVLDGNGDATFAEPVSSTVAPGVVDFLVADFDGDGAPDILAAGAGTRGLSVLLSNSDGSFREPLRHPVSAATRDAVVADFDADGHVDVALWGDDTAAISILLGNGDGSLGPERRWTGGEGPLAVADFDEDGVLDIASAHRERDVLLVSIGVGDGTFLEPVERAFPAGVEYLRVVDVNGDGIGDLLGAHTEFMTGLLSVDGEPFAELRSWYAGNLNVTGVLLSPGSDEESGALAIIGTSRDNSRVVYSVERAETGPSLTRVYPALPLERTSRRYLRTGDLDGDRKQDVLLIDPDENVVTPFLQHENGEFHPPEGLSDSRKGGREDSLLVDLDGDSRDDWISFSWRHDSFGVVLSRGGGGFGEPAVYPLKEPPGGIAVGDFHSDGIPDVAVSVSGDEEKVCLWRGVGGGVLEPADCIPTSGEASVVTAADVNNDGNLDLLAVQGKEVLVLQGQGNGSFQKIGTADVGFSPDLITTTDVERDGIVDIIVAWYRLRRFSLLRGVGDGSFLAPEMTVFVTTEDLTSFLVDDFDGDGVTDVVAGLSGDSLGFVQGRSDGAFEPPKYLYNAGIPMGAVDIGRDGFLDLASVTRTGFAIVRNSSRFLRSGDCDRNHVPDACDLADGAADINENGILDRCETDCDRNGIPDSRDLEVGAALDCNGNGVLDVCDLVAGLDLDCNGNGVPDACDIASGASTDFNADGTPDECQLDCDRNGVPDDTDIARDPSLDCNENGSLDSCELAAGAPDCDGDGVLDECAIRRELTPLTARATRTIPNERAVVFTDFNHDGIDDVVISSRDDRPEVTSYRGQGNGAFHREHSFEEERDVWALAAADIDADGIVDLVYSLLDLDEVRIRPGIGPGEFGPSRILDSNVETEHLEFQDVNADGVQDLVVVPEWDADGRVYQGNGDGTFARPTTLGLVAEPTALRFGDYNEDGNLDFAVLYDRANDLIIRHGQGDGTFEDGVRLRAFSITPDFASLDYDGDGDLDFAIVDEEEGEIEFLAAETGGAYERDFTIELQGVQGNVTVGDWNGDGLGDLIVPRQLTDRARQELHVLAGSPRGLPRRTAVVHRPQWTRAIVAANVDRDRHQDLVIVSDGLFGIRGVGDGTFRLPRVHRTEHVLREARWIDVDDDSLLDMVAVVQSPIPGILIQYGTRAHESNRESFLPTARNLLDFSITDLDGDGFKDIVFADYENNSLGVSYGGGSGQFGAARNVSCESPRTVSAGDFNGDGIDDIAALCDARIHILMGGSEQRPASPRQIGGSVRADPVLIDRIDEDNHLDVAYVTDGVTGETIAVQLGDGAGSFSTAVISPTVERIDRIEQMTLIHLDRDEHIDVALWDAAEDRLVLKRGRGDGTFAGFEVVPAQITSAREFHSADVTGDGIADLTTSGFHVGSLLFVFPGDGAGRVEPEQFFHSVTANIQQLVDIDHDGDLDFVGVPINARSSLVETILNESRGVLAEDCNHNGVPDTCDFESGFSQDLNDSGVPDECEPDCNGNAVPDDLEIARGEATDCDQNGRPDSCDVAEYPLLDRDGNGSIDFCETCRIPGNCNGDDIVDVSDAICLLSHLFLGVTPDLRCSGEEARTALLDWSADGIVDMTDAVRTLVFLFRSGPAHPLAVEGAGTTACRPIEGCAAGGG